MKAVGMESDFVMCKSSNSQVQIIQEKIMCRCNKVLKLLGNWCKL